MDNKKMVMTDFEKRQRCTMGILVLLLPVASLLLGLIGKNNPLGWYNSISNTYFSNSNAIMVSIIAISSFFFCTYKGYDWRDQLVNIISGVGLAGLLIFPCLNEGYKDQLVGVFCLPDRISGRIHDICALTAFVGFFINIEFLFTIGDKNPTKQKKIRNIIYRICGLFIIPVSASLFVLFSLKIGPSYLIMIAEFIALWPCGIAWLIKGGMFKFLND